MLAVYDVLMFVDIVDMVTGQKQSSSGGVSSSSKKPLFFDKNARPNQRNSFMPSQAVLYGSATLPPTIMEAQSKRKVRCLEHWIFIQD